MTRDESIPSVARDESMLLTRDESIPSARDEPIPLSGAEPMTRDESIPSVAKDESVLLTRDKPIPPARDEPNTALDEGRIHTAFGEGQIHTTGRAGLSQDPRKSPRATRSFLAGNRTHVTRDQADVLHQITVTRPKIHWTGRPLIGFMTPNPTYPYTLYNRGACRSLPLLCISTNEINTMICSWKGCKL